MSLRSSIVGLDLEAITIAQIDAGWIICTTPANRGASNVQYSRTA